MEFVLQWPWAVVPKQSEGTTKGLSAISSVVPYRVLKSNLLEINYCIPLQLLVTTKESENEQ